MWSVGILEACKLLLRRGALTIGHIHGSAYIFANRPAGSPINPNRLYSLLYKANDLCDLFIVLMGKTRQAKNIDAQQLSSNSATQQLSNSATQQLSNSARHLRTQIHSQTAAFKLYH